MLSVPRIALLFCHSSITLTSYYSNTRILSRPILSMLPPFPVSSEQQIDEWRHNQQDEEDAKYMIA